MVRVNARSPASQVSYPYAGEPSRPTLFFRTFLFGRSVRHQASELTDHHGCARMLPLSSALRAGAPLCSGGESGLSTRGCYAWSDERGGGVWLLQPCP